VCLLNRLEKIKDVIQTLNAMVLRLTDKNYFQLVAFILTITLVNTLYFSNQMKEPNEALAEQIIGVSNV
jgi:hypothetical protein